MNSRVNNPLFQKLTGLTDIDADDIDCSTLTTSGDIVCNGLINTNDKYVCSMAHRNEIKTLYIVISVLGLFALITIIRLSIHIYQGRLVRKKRFARYITHPIN